MKIYKGISYAKNARTTMRRNVAARIISVRSSVTSREEDRPCSLSVSGPRCWSYSEDGAGLSLSSSTGTHLEWSSVHSGLYGGVPQLLCVRNTDVSCYTPWMNKIPASSLPRHYCGNSYVISFISLKN